MPNLIPSTGYVAIYETKKGKQILKYPVAAIIEVEGEQWAAILYQHGQLLPVNHPDLPHTFIEVLPTEWDRLMKLH